MKKRMSVVLIIILILLLLVGYSEILLLLIGCSESTKQSNSENTYEKYSFTTITHSDDYNIVYQNETKVMYVMSTDYYNIGNFTVLVDENGKPMLYKEN